MLAATATCWPLWLLVLFPFTAQGQKGLQVMDRAEYGIPASEIAKAMYQADQQLSNSEFAAAESTITEVLKRYPLSPAFISGSANGAPVYQTVENYPDRAFVIRATARENLGNYRGAESDMTEAIQYFDKYHFATIYTKGNNKKVEYFRIRANLRLNYLNDKAGGCHDLSILFQSDTTRLTNPYYSWTRYLRSYGCDIPSKRFVINAGDAKEAQWASSDSLRLAQQALNEKRYTDAIRLLNPLMEGSMGRFISYHPPFAGWQLRAQAREALGDYAGALSDLSSGISKRQDNCGDVGYGVLYYKRGILLIDKLQDREKGCADLAKAYRCDTTSTAPSHPQWRECKLPATKVISGKGERAEASRAISDSLRLADSLLLQKQYARVLEVTSSLVNGYAGRFEYTGTGTIRSMRVTRATAFQELGMYTEALAELDYLIRGMGSYTNQNANIYCLRGILKLEKLNDSTGCSDLRQCYLQGSRPPDGNWRGCHIKERTISHKVGRPVGIIAAVLSMPFEGLKAYTPRVGAFYQHQPGLEVGIMHGTGEWVVNHGPSIGLDLLPGYKSYIPVVAPKLAVEGQLGFVAGRLDFTYYGYRSKQDLRLTPQAGVSALAFINLLYGYSIPLLNDEQPFLSRHRISLYYNFVRVTKIGG